MGKEPMSLFEKLVYVAYGYYILVGAIWFFATLYFGHYFNYQAFIITAAFAVQAYYKHRLANLLLGIIIMAVSIFVSLEIASEGAKTSFDPFIDTLLAASVTSIIMSGILVFGYLKISFAGSK